MNLSKLTDGDGKTRNGTQWGPWTGNSCELHPHHEITPELGRRIAAQNDYHDRQDKANSCLIAPELELLAHELLAALRAVLDCPAMCEDTDEPETVKAYDLAMDAIAKAEGITELSQQPSTTPATSFWREKTMLDLFDWITDFVADRDDVTADDIRLAIAREFSDGQRERDLLLAQYRERAEAAVRRLKFLVGR
jgi:hypothetical protein